MRIGHGYDVHKLVENRKLIIGGVTIPYEKGLLGNSDADVLIHAIMDALLGAAALGDIGVHFPDSDSNYHNISSITLLTRVKKLLDKEGYIIANIDCTIVAQEPHLQKYIPSMREHIALPLLLPTECVSIKATTEEELGFTGRKEGIAAHCVCLLEKPPLFADK